MEPEDKQNLFIQPWISPSDFIQGYEFIFQSTSSIPNLSLDNYIASLSTPILLNGLRKLFIWQSRNDNKAFTLSSFLLLDSIIKIKTNEYNNSVDICHILSEKIIRVTNLIIDELKKTKKTSNANMFLVAKDIDLPECIIETRHACTHKNLPHYNTLIFTIKLLFLWVKQKMWDKQYDLYIQEQQYYDYIISYLDNKNIVSLSIKSINKNIHLEVNHLMEIIVYLFKIIKNKLQFDKNKLVLTDNIDKEIAIYKQLQSTENEFVFLMIFLFISQQVLLIIKEDVNKKNISKYNKEIEIIVFFVKFTTKYFTIKHFNYKANTTLMNCIYRHLYQAAQYSILFTAILNSYLFSLNDYHFDQSFLNEEFDFKDIYLYQIKNIPNEENEIQVISNNVGKDDATKNNEDFEYNETHFIQNYPDTLIL